MALVEVEIGISGLLGKGAFLVGGLEAIARSHLVEGADLDRRRAVGIETVRKLRLRRRGCGNGSFSGRSRVDRRLLDRLAEDRLTGDRLTGDRLAEDRLAARRGAKGGQQDRWGWDSVHGERRVPAGYMSPGQMNPARMCPGPMGPSRTRPGPNEKTAEIAKGQPVRGCPFAIAVSSRLE
jgi:hypothetical protein